MTTTVTLDQQTTITSLVKSTETAIVQGILSLDIETGSSNNGPAAITFANKGVSSNNIITTIYSTSTSTSIPTSTHSSTATTYTNLNTLFQQSTESTTSNIGLIVGLPIAIIGSILIALGLYFYFRQRKANLTADHNFSNTYDDKFNYRISPTTRNINSPYKSKTTVQLKDNPSTDHLNKFTDSTHTLMKEPPSQPQYSASNFTQSQSELSLKELPKRNSRWSLGSPLSKWFIKPASNTNNQLPMSQHYQEKSSFRSSIRSSLSTGAPFSPVVALKEFKLKRSNKDVITNPTPVVPALAYHPSSHLKHSYKESWDSSIHSFQSDDTVVKQQVLRSSKIVPPTPPTLQPIPKHKKVNRALPAIKASLDTSFSTKSSTTSSSLQGFENKISQTRQNPTTPKINLSKYNNPSIYKVIKTYQKNLGDELNIRKGEYVKILSKHTDGWCLVEKVDKFGITLVKTDENEWENERYLNDGRGVVPEVCLQKYISF